MTNLINIEAVYGTFWDSRDKGWAVFINGKVLRREHNMNHFLPVVRKYKTKEGAERGALKALASFEC